MRYWSSVTCFSRLLKQESEDLQTDYKGIPGYQQRPRCCETTKLETCAKRLASSWRPKKAHHIFGVLRMNPLFGCWYWDFRSCLLWTPKTGLFRENIITSWFESENSLGWVGWRFCLVVLDFLLLFFFSNAKPAWKILQSVYIRVDFTSNIMSVCVCTCLCNP